MSDEKAVRAMLTAVRERYGHISCVVHGAAVNLPERAAKATYDKASVDASTCPSAHSYTHTFSNGANGLISYGDMILIHSYIHKRTKDA